MFSLYCQVIYAFAFAKILLFIFSGTSFSEMETGAGCHPFVEVIFAFPDTEPLNEVKTTAL
jgi:hypothetical protein